MVATSAISNLIREGKTHQMYSSLQAGKQHGMVTMDQSLADLVSRPAGHLRRGARALQQRPRLQPPLRPRLREPAMPTDLLTFRYTVRDSQGKTRDRRRSTRPTRRPSSASCGRWATPRSRSSARSRPRRCKKEITLPGFGKKVKLEGPGGLLAPVRDDDQLGAVADPRPEHPRRADGEQGARPRSSARSAAHVEQGRPLSAAMRRARGVPQAVHRDGARRRDRGPARPGAAARRRHAGDGHGAARARSSRR